MKTLGMTVHFKTRCRGAIPGEPAGGFCAVYGQFQDFESFEEAVSHHFRRAFRYDVVACEDQREVSSAPISAETPIVYQTMHLYRES